MHSGSNQIDLTYQLSDNKVLIVIADQGDITAQKITELNQKSINYESHGGERLSPNKLLNYIKVKLFFRQSSRLKSHHFFTFSKGIMTCLRTSLHLEN